MQVSFKREWINQVGTIATEWFLCEGYKTIRVQGIAPTGSSIQLQVITTNVEEITGVPLNSSGLNAGGGVSGIIVNTYESGLAWPICWKWCKVQMSSVTATNRTIVVTLQD